MEKSRSIVTILPLRKTMSAGCGTASDRAKSTSAPEQLTSDKSNAKYPRVVKRLIVSPWKD
jgi:hypothetical protein